MTHRSWIPLAATALAAVGTIGLALAIAAHALRPISPAEKPAPLTPIRDVASFENRNLAAAAASQIGRTTSYDPAYVEIDFPYGDVPIETGVCTDVVIRALRETGIDLQVELNKDMTRNFSAYPRLWRLTKPDPNIDHRRVPNLRVWFGRQGKSLPVSHEGADYQPGDIVTWKPLKRPHTGVVSTQRSADGQRFLIVHNFGDGVVLEDVLFRWEITGHYRYY